MGKFRAAGVSPDAHFQELLVVGSCLAGIASHLSSAPGAVERIESVGAKLQFGLILSEGLFRPFHFDENVSKHFVCRDHSFWRKGPLFFGCEHAESTNGLVVPASAWSIQAEATR